jgi:hypothetical protein
MAELAACPGVILVHVMSDSWWIKYFGFPCQFSLNTLLHIHWVAHHHTVYSSNTVRVIKQPASEKQTFITPNVHIDISSAGFRGFHQHYRHHRLDSPVRALAILFMNFARNNLSLLGVNPTPTPSNSGRSMIFCQDFLPWLTGSHFKASGTRTLPLHDLAVYRLPRDRGVDMHA